MSNVWGFHLFLLLAVIFIGLSVVLLLQLYLAIKKEFKDKHRNLTIVVLTVVLILVLLKPNGIIDFEKFESKEIFVAFSEGSANCVTTLKLRENGAFSQKNICFGIVETKGKYEFRNDTIYFKNVKFDTSQEKYFEFAVIKLVRVSNYDKYYELALYKNKSDANPYKLSIIKNELVKLK